jgi:hypothetical protein
MYAGKHRLPTRTQASPHRRKSIRHAFTREVVSYRSGLNEPVRFVMLSYCTSPTCPPSGSDVVYAGVTESHIHYSQLHIAAHELPDKCSPIYTDRYYPRGHNAAPTYHPLIQRLAYHCLRLCEICTSNTPHFPLFPILYARFEMKYIIGLVVSWS